MFVLLRVAFWLTIVLALLPSGGAKQSAQAQIDATDAVVAASAAVSDMTNFCDRQPDACVVGAQAAVAIGQRAQAGAKMVYEFINGRIAHGETGSVTAARQQDAKVVPVHAGQTTLKPADLGPTWRGPAPRKEAQPRRDTKHPA